MMDWVVLIYITNMLYVMVERGSIKSLDEEQK